MSDHDTNEAPLMLTISGARGIVGASMTPEVAHRLAATWGDDLASTTDGSPVVVLGRDSRHQVRNCPRRRLAGSRTPGARSCRWVSSPRRRRV